MSSILDGRPGLAAVIDQVAEVTGYLWQKGWAERNGGNITVNVTEFVDDEIKAMPAIAPAKQIGKVLPYLKGKYFYAKGTGKRMRDLARWPMQNGAIIRICDDCASYEIIADEPVMPTSELPSHLALQNYLLETGSTYKATLHTHPIELVAMSHIRRFLKGDEIDKVRHTIIINGALNAKIVGQSAVKIAELAGITVPEKTKILIGEVDSVEISEPFAHEKLSPVLAMYRAARIPRGVAALPSPRRLAERFAESAANVDLSRLAQGNRRQRSG